MNRYSDWFDTIRRKEIKKQTYEELNMETILFDTEDVITTRAGDSDEECVG